MATTLASAPMRRRKSSAHTTPMMPKAAEIRMAEHNRLNGGARFFRYLQNRFLLSPNTISLGTLFFNT